MSIAENQLKEIQELKEQTSSTARATVPELEKVMFDPIKVLDHGFVRVVDYMGDDNAIVQAARVSYGKGTKKVNQDAALIAYLLRHWHTTPFEMCEIKFHIKMPIFVARQWIRHRTANVNEYSARYSILGKEFYMPEPKQLAAQSTQNHQGRAEDNVLTGEEANRVFSLLKEDSENCYSHYEEMMNETQTGDVINPDNKGLARELARMNLTLNYYTEWYWKIDLHNFMHFLRLRADSHAQYEIRVYADAMVDVLKRWVPATYKAFLEYRQGATNISKTGMEVVRELINGKKVSHAESGLGKREWNELMDTLNKPELKA